MAKPVRTNLVQYEFDVYVPLLDSDSAYKVCDITLTEDDFMPSSLLQRDEAIWKQVDRFCVVYTEVHEVKYSFVKTERRICGLFDAEPLDWKYATIGVRDEKNKKFGQVTAKMPLSPIMPVLFFIDLKIFDKKENENV